MKTSPRNSSLSSSSPDKLQTVQHGGCFSLSASLYRQTNKHSHAQSEDGGNPELACESLTN